jgi:hypothetical protein
MAHPENCRCPECALARRLAAWTPDKLEAAVPDHLVAGLWDRLEPELEPRAPIARAPRGWWRRAAPAWAAALLLLVVNAMLVKQVVSLRQQLAQPTPGAALASGPSSFAHPLPAGWQQRTVGEVVAWLAAVPPETTVLDPRQTRALGAPSRLHGIRTDDGLQAGEALALVSAFDLRDGTTLATLLSRKGSPTWNRT